MENNFIGIKDEYYILLKINNKEYSFEKGEFISLTIYEDVNKALPEFKLDLIDYGDLIRNNDIYDNTKVTILLSKDKIFKEKEVLNFIVVKPEIYNNPKGYQVILKGLLDVPKWLYGINRISFSGNSYEVIRDIASINKLNAITDNTSDNQKWVNFGMNYYRFTQDITDHAWSNNNSCFISCIDRKRNLKFYNLSVRKDIKPKYIMVEQSSSIDYPNQDEVPVLEASIVNNSGLLNKLYSYGREVEEFNVTTDGYISDKLEAKTPAISTKYLNMNKDYVSFNRCHQSPFNLGNTHSNYSKAKYQNNRYLGLYSIGVIVTTVQPKDISLLDRVEVKLKNNVENKTSISYDGNYFVERMVTHLSFNNLSMRYELKRDGLNPRTSEDLVG